MKQYLLNQWLRHFQPSARTPIQSYRRYQRLLRWMKFKQWTMRFFRDNGVYLCAFVFISALYAMSSITMSRDAYKRGQYDGMSKTLQTLAPHMCVPNEPEADTERSTTSI